MNKKSFTLIELIVVLVVMGIIAAVTSMSFIFFVDNIFSMPAEMNMYSVSSDIFQIICEGDSISSGLRFSRDIVDIENNYIRFIDSNGKNVEIKKENQRILRAVNGGQFQKIPYYMPHYVFVIDNSENLFSYYDEYDTITSVASNVKTVKIHLGLTTNNIDYEMETKVGLRQL